MARKLNWLLFLVTLTSCPVAGLAADSEAPLTSLLQQKEVQFQVPSEPGQVQKTLSDYGLNKGVTLALQSLDEKTLEYIKRGNMFGNEKN